MDIRFSEVSHVEFNDPQEHPFIYLAYKAGDTYRCGFLNLKKKTYPENIYRDMRCWPYYDEKGMTKNDLLGMGFSEEQFSESGNVLTKPGVRIHFLSGDKKYADFDTYQEAMDFFNRFDTMKHRLTGENSNVELK